jgi:hypothetical protein
LGHFFFEKAEIVTATAKKKKEFQPSTPPANAVDSWHGTHDQVQSRSDFKEIRIFDLINLNWRK